MVEGGRGGDHVGEGRLLFGGEQLGEGGCYLSGRLQQRGGLGRPRLLDHVVEEAVPVLQQHVGLVVLLDPAGSQNLQSGGTHTHTHALAHNAAGVRNVSPGAPALYSVEGGGEGGEVG